MSRDEETRPGLASGAGSEQVGETVTSQDTQLADTWAWTGVFLADGRMVSLAWLRGWPGAVASPAREMRRG
jgi:hypothetical protein